MTPPPPRFSRSTMQAGGSSTTAGYRHGYDHLATGLMLKALCIKDAIESGLTYFDLLRGAEHYKYHPRWR